MKKIIRTYLTWAICGALAGPFLWDVFAAFHVSQIQGLFTFEDAFRQLIQRVADGKDLEILTTLAMPTGAILFVIARFIAAFFTGGTARMAVSRSDKMLHHPGAM
jgi:hypothetical protein